MQKIKLSRQKMNKKNTAIRFNEQEEITLLLLHRMSEKKIETFLLKFSGGKINALIFYVNIKK